MATTDEQATLDVEQFAILLALIERVRTGQHTEDDLKPLEIALENCLPWLENLLDLDGPKPEYRAEFEKGEFERAFSIMAATEVGHHWVPQEKAASTVQNASNRSSHSPTTSTSPNTFAHRSSSQQQNTVLGYQGMSFQPQSFSTIAFDMICSRSFFISGKRATYCQKMVRHKCYVLPAINGKMRIWVTQSQALHQRIRPISSSA